MPKNISLLLLVTIPVLFENIINKIFGGFIIYHAKKGQSVRHHLPLLRASQHRSSSSLSVFVLL